MTQEPNNREQDIRRLLKTFGVKADQLIQEHFQEFPDLGKIHMRLVLVDLTDYGKEEPEPRLHFEVEGDVRRE